MAASSHYHHGNARTALIDAGLELLQHTPANEISLRAVAEAAGLSRQAPYNHFSSKEAMLASFAQHGFVELANRMKWATISKAKPQAMLQAIAAAYINFACTFPNQFRLMFTKELVNIENFVEASAASDDAFGVLVTSIENIASAEVSADLAIAAWCLVHGYATLVIEADIEPQSMIANRAIQFATMISKSADGLDRSQTT